jgi:pimeloyl-ACP methyl ester carboxylesterase
MLPQFTLPIQVDGFEPLNIHFVHQTSSHKDAIPLIFIHGWPGHFNEVSKILPLLTEPVEGEQAFHVVAPSIPGFAFSSNPTRKGFNLHKIADTFNQLMLALGYKQYVSQGGDWGSSLTRMMGLLYPQNCRAVHVNMLKTVDPPTWYKNPLLWIKMQSQLVSYTQEEEAMIARARWFDTKESGYRVRLLERG